MTIEEHVPLADHTTLGVGGVARSWAQCASEPEFEELAAWARERGLPWMVMGGGSNLVVGSRGFDGLVIHMGLRGLRLSDDGAVEAAAGEDWDGVAAACVETGLAGIECLSGIPGTVGAAPVQNIGAYGQELADTLVRVRAWDRWSETWTELDAGACGFGYRASRFNQQDKGRFVITRVWLQLRPGSPPTLRYPELAQRGPITLADARAAVRELRRGKAMLLDPADPDSRSAGSFFKNPVVAVAAAARIAAMAGQAPPQFAAGAGQMKIPAAWLIERAGFARGYRLAGSAVGLSRRHVLAIVNYGGGTGEEVMALAEEIRQAVAARFGVTLEPEPERLGF
ncbi:MAG TPA: UDP-N-acetylmuramate dehydrogenase [Terriglobales bacterium]|nr:UDP-N-acetylmuramate dehydrogenase [Terriglobales bacterium]